MVMHNGIWDVPPCPALHHDSCILLALEADGLHPSWELVPAALAAAEHSLDPHTRLGRVRVRKG